MSRLINLRLVFERGISVSLSAVDFMDAVKKSNIIPRLGECVSLYREDQEKLILYEVYYYVPGIISNWEPEPHNLEQSDWLPVLKIIDRARIEGGFDPKFI